MDVPTAAGEAATAAPGSPATPAGPGSGPDQEAPLVDCAGGVKRISERRARAFLGLTQAAIALDRALDAELQAQHGISLRTFGILLHLAAFAPEGHLRMGQLAERAALVQAPLSPSRLSRLIAQLEREGLLRRETSPDDARGVIVSITGYGLDKLREAQETHYRGLEERLFSRLTDEEVDQLGDIAARILADGGC